MESAARAWFPELLGWLMGTARERPIDGKGRTPLEERSAVILAGDIGGTNARLALFDRSGDDLHMRVQQDYHTKDYPSLEEVIRVFLQKNGGAVEAASFGVAGPVLNNKVTATNLAWAIDGA